MAAVSSDPAPKGSRKKVRRTRYTCPACGKVSVFTTGQVLRCKSCGRYAGEDEPLGEEPAPAAPPATQPVQPTPSARPAGWVRREPPTALAVGSLACGLAAAAGLWVFPVALLLAIAAVALGATALSRHEDDAGVQVMSVIGIIVGGLVLLFAFLLWPLFLYEDDGGSSYTYYDGGGSSTSVEVENNGGSSGDGGSSGGGGGETSGGSGGGGGGGGGSGGDGGGGAVEVGGGGEAESPSPAGLSIGALLVGLAAWSRRA